jgi:hypothetical protein
MCDHKRKERYQQHQRLLCSLAHHPFFTIHYLLVVAFSLICALFEVSKFFQTFGSQFLKRVASLVYHHQWFVFFYFPILELHIEVLFFPNQEPFSPCPLSTAFHPWLSPCPAWPLQREEKILPEAGRVLLWAFWDLMWKPPPTYDLVMDVPSH